jgi:hypothetical protein
VRSLPTQGTTAVAALAVIVALTFFAQSHAGQAALTRLGVAGHPARYTELAFAQPLRLPAHLPRKPTAVDGAFTITNRQGRAESYSWRIVANGAVEHVLASGELSLAAGQRAYVDPLLTVTCSSKRLSVDVRLASGEHIDFLAQCAASTRARSHRHDALPTLRPLLFGIRSRL